MLLRHVRVSVSVKITTLPDAEGRYVSLRRLFLRLVLFFMIVMCGGLLELSADENVGEFIGEIELFSYVLIAIVVLIRCD